MAAGDNRIYKSVVLPASGPGEFAEVDVTGTGIIAGDLVVASIRGTTRPVTSVGDSFNVYVESVATGTVKIKSNKMQTPQVTINVVVVASA